MTTCRRSHLLYLVLLAASSALLGAGCSNGNDSGAGPDTGALTTDGVEADEMTLDGVRFDVRRDPG